MSAYNQLEFKTRAVLLEENTGEHYLVLGFLPQDCCQETSHSGLFPLSALRSACKPYSHRRFHTTDAPISNPRSRGCACDSYPVHYF